MHAIIASRRPTPTPAEQEALRFFHDFMVQHFCPPSMEECATQLNLPYMTAWRLLHSLWSKGYLLQDEDRKLRPWRLADTPRPARIAVLNCAGDIS